MIKENTGTAMSADAQSTFKKVLVRRMGVVLSSAAVAAGLVGCGAIEDLTGSGGKATATETVTETATQAHTSESIVESSSAAEESDLRKVDPEKFAVKTSGLNLEATHAFLFALDGEERQCMFTEEFVRCAGTPGPEIPNLDIKGSMQWEMTGEDSAPASHISADSKGLLYVAGTNFINVEAETALEAGEQFEFGDVTCAAIDDSTLTCTVDGEGFTLTGKEALISTTAELNNEDFVK